MTLKVIGAGFGRTGTSSTKAALDELGLPCYHFSEIILNKNYESHLDFWGKVANAPPGTQHDWSRVFSKYAATLDNPACCVWRELLVAYPDAKVLLTLHPRGAEVWYDSTMETLYDFSENVWQFKVLELLVPSARKLGVTRKLIWGRTLNGVMGDKAKAVARYNDYIGEVKAAVPPDKLLIFRVTDGWDPLCAFLSVAKPETDFPNLNDRASTKKNIGRTANLANLLLAGIAAAALLVSGGAYWLLR